MALRPISKAEDVRLPEGSYDVRGWEVRTSIDDEKVGKVHDVLIDERGRARYLDIDLGIFKKHVLLPIGQAQADAREDAVWVPGMSKDSFEAIPEWDHETTRLNAEYESSLGTAYAGAYGTERYYERPEYSATWWRGRETEPAEADVGTTHSRLRSLSELDDYEVADDDPDPRGWRVDAADGRKVGEVQELIVDAAAMKVRYLDVELDTSELGLSDRDRHVLVPVGFVRLDDRNDRVLLDAFTSSQVIEMPRHAETGQIDRTYEDSLRTRYDNEFRGERRYEHPRYRSERFYVPRGDRTDIRR